MSLCFDAQNFVRTYIGDTKVLNVSVKSLDQSSDFLQHLNSSSVYHRVFNHWCSYSAISTSAHYFVGILLILVGIAGIGGNGLVVLVFTRYRRLRTPANRLIVNLAVSDLMMSFLHFMASYSSFRKSWQFGKIGCEFYGSLCGLFGLVSIVTLSAIALERCLVIAIKPWYCGYPITKRKLGRVVAFIWLYCFVCVTPPFLGWGSYVPEGFLTSCSFDYLTRTPTNRSYFFFLFILGFILPLSVIATSYCVIWKTVVQHEREMSQASISSISPRFMTRKRSDFKSAIMILCVIGLFLLSWSPYAAIATIGQFCNSSYITPWVSAMPALFAKMSTMYNPIIYGISHRRFCSCIRLLFMKTQIPPPKKKIYMRFSKGLPRRDNRQTFLSTACGDYRVRGDVSLQPTNKGRKCYVMMSLGREGKSTNTVFAEPQAEHCEKLTCDLCLLEATAHKYQRNMWVRKLLSDSSIYSRSKANVNNDLSLPECLIKQKYRYEACFCWYDHKNSSICYNTTCSCSCEFRLEASPSSAKKEHYIKRPSGGSLPARCASCYYCDRKIIHYY
uniref:Arthopsin 2 n=1 Tax=Limulus polyphemus TaxID=6850 RepID=A0A172ZA88_LIMPO|nr:arthopsin 2 [Limulus polyphemus]